MSSELGVGRGAAVVVGAVGVARARATASAATVGEDALLLREFAHRALNDVAVAVAAVNLAERGGADDRRRLLAEARARLEGSGALMRLLARPPEPRVDLGAGLAELCGAMRAARATGGGGELVVDAPALWVDGAVARRLLLIAAELVGNAYRHALAGRDDGRLSVTMRRVRGRVRVDVRDDGPPAGSARPTAGTGWGRGIVAELARRAGGTVALVGTGAGTLARLEAPIGPAREVARGG